MEGEKYESKLQKRFDRTCNQELILASQPTSEATMSCDAKLKETCNLQIRFPTES